jgi:hypothetical protein
MIDGLIDRAKVGTPSGQKARIKHEQFFDDYLK